MNDLRDTTTSNAMSLSIKNILTGDVLKCIQSSIKKWMINNKVADNMLRASSKGWGIADRSGASDMGSEE